MTFTAVVPDSSVEQITSDLHASIWPVVGVSFHPSYNTGVQLGT